MGNIESKIGKTPVSSVPMRTFTVDDPTALQDIPAANETPAHMKQISPQQFQEYRNQIAALKQEQSQGSSQQFGSTEDVLAPTRGTREHNPEDEQLLSMFTGNSSSISRNTSPVEEKMPQDRKDILEVLLGLNQKTASTEIEGHEIVLRKLKSDENKRIFKHVNKLPDPIEKIYTTKHFVLALSVVSVDGQELSEILSGGEDEDKLRLELIQNMESEAVEQLWNTYKDKISNVYNVSSPEATKEVISDLKK